MTNRNDYMRAYMARKRWPEQVEACVERLEALLKSENAGAVSRELCKRLAAAQRELQARQV